MTVLFSDLSGYTAMNESLDPEVVAEITNEIKAEATRIIESYGGTVNQFVGDEVMALFGLPRAEEDDPRRSVAAALELHERVRAIDAAMEPRLEQPLRMHTGIQTGLVIAQLRDARDGLYGVNGDAVNTAARLASLAEEDQVWIGGETFSRVFPYFESESIGSQRVRGKAEIVETHRILGRRSVGSRFEAAQEQGLSPRVGRSRELRLLEEAFGRVVARGGALATVKGEAGVGKSRLLHDFTLGLAGEEVEICEGRCAAFGAVTPYRPFLQVLRRTLGVSESASGESIIEAVSGALAGEGPELASQIAPLLHLLGAPSESHPMPPDAAGEELPDALQSALVHYLRWLSSKRPLLLLLEDWHWADLASDLTLRRLASSIAADPILIVVAHRPSLSPSWPELKYEELSLYPFDRSDTDALVAHCLAANRVDEALCDQIHERTLGNPFFVEEVCVALAGSSALTRDGDRISAARELTDLELPESVQSVLRSRIDKLDGREREVLRLASVIGREFGSELLRRLSPDATGLDESLEELCRREFVHPQTEGSADYRFKHVTTQEVAYASLLRRRRAAIHRRVAESILALNEGREGDHYEELAEHYLAAGDDPDALRFLVLAGDKAAASFAMHQAREHYRRAVERTVAIGDDEETVKQRIDLTLRYAATCPFNPSESQIPLLRDAVRQGQEVGMLAHAVRSLYWICWILYSIGDHDRAIEETRKALERIEPFGNDDATGMFLCLLGNCYALARDFVRAQDLLSEGVAKRRAHAEATGAEIGGTTAYALAQHAMTLSDLGRNAESNRLMEEALRIVGDLGQRSTESSVRITMGFIAAQRWDWNTALECAQQGRLLAQNMDAPYHLATCESLEGQARLHLGARESGLSMLRRGLVLLDRSLPLTRTWALAALAEGLVDCGEMIEAEGVLAQAEERRASMDRWGIDIAMRARARLDGHRSPEGCVPALDRLLRDASGSGSPRELAAAHVVAAELAFDHGMSERAELCLAESEKLLAGLQVEGYAARAGELRARLR